MVGLEAGIYLSKKKYSFNSNTNKMKQIMLLLAAFLFILEISQAQDSLHATTPNPSNARSYPPVNPYFSSEYYMNKSNKMKTTGWVLISVGTVLGIAGYFVYENQLNTDYNSIDDAIGSTLGATILMAGGTAMVVVGIPVLIKSGYYKRKALNMSAMMKFETYQTGVAFKQLPALGLSIRL